VEYVNSALKGVNGHPLQVDVCQTDGTAEANVNCANGFVQNHDVAVLDGYDLADGAEQPILDRAGISDIGIVAGNETVDTSPNDFFLGPADEAFGSGPLQILHGQGVNSIAFAAPNLPADQTYANAALLPPAEKPMPLSLS
jgi:branched-chain amino acid transport system substrate-binding protein